MPKLLGGSISTAMLLVVVAEGAEAVVIVDVELPSTLETVPAV
jgi:hypothetical protein